MGLSEAENQPAAGGGSAILQGPGTSTAHPWVVLIGGGRAFGPDPQ